MACSQYTEPNVSHVYGHFVVRSKVSPLDSALAHAHLLSSHARRCRIYYFHQSYPERVLLRVTLKCEKESFSRKGPNFTKRTKETGIGLVFTNYFILTFFRETFYFCIKRVLFVSRLYNKIDPFR